MVKQSLKKDRVAFYKECYAGRTLLENDAALASLLGSMMSSDSSALEIIAQHVHAGRMNHAHALAVSLRFGASDVGAFNTIDAIVRHIIGAPHLLTDGYYADAVVRGVELVLRVRSDAVDPVSRERFEVVVRNHSRA